MHRDRLTPGCPGVRQSIARTRPFTEHGVRNKQSWMNAKTSLDQEKVAEKTGLGGSGSHWTPTQLQLVPSPGKKGLVASLGKPWSMQLTGSQLQKGGEARRSGETTFTTPDLLQLGLWRTLSLHCLCELCSLSDTRRLPRLCLPINHCFHYHLEERP